MKKLFTFISIMALSVMALQSCEMEVIIDEPTDIVADSYKEITLSAGLGDGTKSMLDGVHVVWEVGEEVAVYADGFSGVNRFSVVSVDGTNVVISGSVPEGASKLTAVYPFDSAVSCKGNEVRMRIPAEQKLGESRTIASDALCSVAVYPDLNSKACFRNVCTLLSFSLKAPESISALQLLSAPSDAGKDQDIVSVTVSADSEPAVINEAGGFDVKIIPAESFQAATKYYVAVPPCNPMNGLSTRLFKGVKAASNESAGSQVLQRNHVVSLGELSEDGAQYKYFWHFSGGAGTAEEPFEISTAKDLDSLSYYSNLSDATLFTSACYKQTADIDMKGITFNPVAQNSSFKGVYDGNGKSVSNLKIASTVSKPAGFIAKGEGAVLKDLSFINVDIDSKYVYCGALVGYASKCAISNCYVSGQVRQYTGGITVGEANVGYSGGLVGWMDSTTLSNCTLDGNATFYGKFSGGCVGYAKNSIVENCRVTKDHTVNVYYHWAGGVIGKAEGANTLIKGCSFEGNLTNVGYILGGIVGQVMGGRVEECVFGSYGDMGSDKYFVGGIVGAAVPTADIVIDKCAVYGRVKGQYSVGAVVGYTGFLTSTLKVAAATKSVVISDCASIGAEITATGNNGGSNAYSLVTGLCGWTHGSSVTTIKGCYAAPSLIQTTSVGNRGALGGISGYQNCTETTIYENCYSTITPDNVLNRGERVTDVTGTCFYGAIYARCTQSTTVRNCFWDEAMKQIGPAEGKTTESGNEALSTAQLTDGTLLAKLQATANGTTWVSGANGLPTIQGLPADPNVKPKPAKRLSVIGDSISTFKGWIPANYSAHYPATDGTLTLVNETYWYRLAHDYMKDCAFDTNIAFSGSTVTNTTEENYKARYGSASNAWFKKDFCTRFTECGGCGRPDIILIHGGTNDWAHNADPLAPGVAIRNDASNIYGGSAPSESVMASIYATADAAKTRSEVNALPDGTFCEAYVKLLCQIRERYPQCKVVCIIGDYLSQSIEQSVIEIAGHYGAKTVNLFRVNGFNDLGGYSPETLSNKGKQPNMPKHDYSGDVGGCHPGSQAMEFIAAKIYAELGAWLEE